MNVQRMRATAKVICDRQQSSTRRMKSEAAVSVSVISVMSVSECECECEWCGECETVCLSVKPLNAIICRFDAFVLCS